MKNVILCSVLAAAHIFVSYRLGCVVGECLAESILDLLDSNS
jgi:hypothetical protein